MGTSPFTLFSHICTLQLLRSKTMPEVLAMGRTLSGQIPIFCCCGFKSPGCEFQVKLPRNSQRLGKSQRSTQSLQVCGTRQLPAEVSLGNGASIGKWNLNSAPFRGSPLSLPWVSCGSFLCATSKHRSLKNCFQVAGFAGEPYYCSGITNSLKLTFPT